MFAIFRCNKRYGNKTFDSYEQARSYARKLIRAGKFGTNYLTNPAISEYNLSVKAI